MSDTPRPKSDLHVTPPPRLARQEGRAMSEGDVEKLQEMINKVASAVNRSATHTERIPEVVKKVEVTNDRVVELKTEVRGLGERVTRIESRVDRGHDCFQVEIISELKDGQREVSQKIEKDILEGAQRAGELATLRKETAETVASIKDIEKAPRRMLYGFIGIILTILSGAGGAVWFLAELNKDVEFERTQRTEQIGRIESQIKTVAIRTDTAPVTQEIKTLTKAVRVSNGYEEAFNTLCAEMTSHEKRFTRNALLKKGGRVPLSCLE